LTLPALTLAREQPLTEDRSHMTKEERELDEIAMILNQHIFDMTCSPERPPV
jgi:hypothetical protein